MKVRDLRTGLIFKVNLNKLLYIVPGYRNHRRVYSRPAYMGEQLSTLGPISVLLGIFACHETIHLPSFIHLQRRDTDR